MTRYISKEKFFGIMTEAETDKNSETDKLLFPHEEIRNVQNELIEDVSECINNKKNIIVHAPTGLGKTAAALAPALTYALKNKKKIFFLTSRHTQHAIAIDTLRDIKKRHGVNISAVDLIGKKWLCPEEGMDKLPSGQFAEYCRKQREKESCEFFNNTKKGTHLTTEAKLTMERLKRESPMHIEEFTQICREAEVCTYEMAVTLAKEADVVVADYYYMFNPSIRNAFLKRIDTNMSDCIVIVDEAHNLPDRVRTLMTKHLTSNMTKYSLSEAKKIDRMDLVSGIAQVQDILMELSEKLKQGEEIIIGKQRFIDDVEEIEGVEDYDGFFTELEFAASVVRESEKRSSIGGVADFLTHWKGPDDGFARIISVGEMNRETVISLAYRCLDPSIVTREVIESCHSVIMMSGTLQPTHMYKDLLGFDSEDVERAYPSPFPNKNRLNLIIPETTTKFAARGDAQYERMAEIIGEVSDGVKGNCAVFFPSYYLRDQVYRYLGTETKKTIFVEQPGMTKEEKAEFLEKFKSYSATGAVLLGAITGSYGEGIDLPGDLLNCVIVVGLPLQKPTLEINCLIKYYDAKFNKGWDYGYVNPAFQKTLQSAGRCIRSSTDRGVIVFLDERYAWQNYYCKFPKDWDIVVSRHYMDEINDFFRE